MVHFVYLVIECDSTNLYPNNSKINWMIQSYQHISKDSKQILNFRIEENFHKKIFIQR